MHELAYIVLVRALQVHDSVEELAEQSENTLVCVQRLEARKETDELFELLPLSRIECLLRTVSHTLHSLNRHLRLNLVSVERNCCHEWNLEGLLDEAVVC
jgi:hypothetical protein